MTLRYHGDQAVGPGLLDFAVNVQLAQPPQWLQEALAARLADLAAYPTQLDDIRAREAIASRHGRRPNEVLLLSGAAEGFALIAGLGFEHAAVVHPSFTEPEHALRSHGVPVERAFTTPDLPSIPDSADLVVLGNPTNPTSTLHPAARILAMRKTGRILVIDEAFADSDPGEPESLANHAFDDVIVVRSLTKTWGIAGLRCGYLLAAPAMIERLSLRRPHWPLGTLQLEAIYQCSQPAALSLAADHAREMAANRDYLIEQLTALGLSVHEPATAPFVLVGVPKADTVRHRLAADFKVAVRRCDTFPGLHPDHLRLAVRPRPDIDRLISALGEIL